MSFQPQDYFASEQQRPYVPNFWGPRTPSEQSQVTVLPYDDTRLLDDYDSPVADDSSLPTVIPYAPSPPEIARTPPELYGNYQLFGPLLEAAFQGQRPAPPPVARPSPPASRQLTRHFSRNPPVVHFDEAQLAMDTAANLARGMSLRDELTIAAGTVTPGVDDTPYIQFALDALTREGGAAYSRSIQSSSTDDDGGYRGSILGTDPELAFMPTLAQPLSTLTRDPMREEAYPHQGLPSQQFQRFPPPENRGENLGRSPAQPPPRVAAWNNRSPSLSSTDSGAVKPAQQVRSFDRTRWLPVEESMLSDPRVDSQHRIYPRLTYKPRILRLPSMITLMTLCVLMITGLMFSAIYANHHTGFMPYGGSITSGQYFLFRIFPQILAAVILVYAQGVITTCFRVLPFALMADRDPGVRYDALFQDLYPKSFLWPHLVGPGQIRLCIFITWLMNFTLPLQSAAFTVILVNDGWVWTAVQGPVWTLVVLYICLLGSTLVMALWWHHRTTGIMWDVRSIADIIPMLNRSNALADYDDTWTAGTRGELRALLRGRRIDRLGYWKVQDPTIGFWYGIGIEAAQANFTAVDLFRATGRADKLERPPPRDARNREDARYRYLPWCLRNTQLIYFVVAGAVLLVALFAVSFVEGTRLTRGFLPELRAAPGRGAFSPADFLYSFLPSLLGQVLFLLFQALDLSVRIYTPWAALSQPRGAAARDSVLLDLAACLPFQAAWRALRRRQPRAAFISALSAAYVLLPVLAGGLFMALTVAGTDEVRMFPNVPVLAVLLSLLVLYWVGLALLLPGRGRYRLPHAVTCLAEIISLCSARELVTDAAFRSPRSRADMLGRLSVGRAEGDQPLWVFGAAPGSDARWSVRKMARFTERKARERGGEAAFTEKRAPRPMV